MYFSSGVPDTRCWDSMSFHLRQLLAGIWRVSASGRTTLSVLCADYSPHMGGFCERPNLYFGFDKL